jgi:RarD protein
VKGVRSRWGEIGGANVKSPRGDSVALTQGYAAIVASMLIWGSIGIFVRQAGQDPLIAVIYRVIFASLALAVYAALRSAPGPVLWKWERRLILPFVGSGIALAANWLFFFMAIETTSVSNAVLSYYTAPVLTAIAAPLLLKEALERRTVLATALASGGVFVMLYQPGETLLSTDLIGIGYGIVAACFYATVTLTARWLRVIPAASLVFGQSVVSALILIPVALWRFGPSALAAPLPAVGLLAIVGIVHTAVALFLYFEGVRAIKVQHVGVLAYLDPVSAVLFAFLFLAEVPTGASLIGGGLVLLASALLLRPSP